MTQINDFRKPFQKSSEPIFYGDNREDEMIASALDFYPRHKQRIFLGEKGLMEKKNLHKELRQTFNFLQGAKVDEDTFNFLQSEDSEEFLNLSFGKKLKNAFKKISINNVKKELKKVSVNNIKKELKQVGDKTKKVLKQISLKNITKGLKLIGKVLAKAALAVPRGAFLGLVRLNFRAVARRFNALNQQGEDKIMKLWDNLGGDKAALRRAIEAGKDKHALACGKKCRAKAGANPSLPSEAEEKFLTFLDPATASLVAAGVGILGQLVSTVKGKDNYKSQQEADAIDQEEADAQAGEDKIDATMSPQEKALADSIVQAQNDKFDTVKAISDNPNLSQAEKMAALQHLKDVTEGEGFSMGKKIGIAFGVLGLLGIVFYFLTKKKN